MAEEFHNPVMANTREDEEDPPAFEIETSDRARAIKRMQSADKRDVGDDRKKRVTEGGALSAYKNVKLKPAIFQKTKEKQKKALLPESMELLSPDQPDASVSPDDVKTFMEDKFAIELRLVEELMQSGTDEQSHWNELWQDEIERKHEGNLEKAWDMCTADAADIGVLDFGKLQGVFDELEKIEPNFSIKIVGKKEPGKVEIGRLSKQFMIGEKRLQKFVSPNWSALGEKAQQINREDFLGSKELSKVLALTVPTRLDYEDADMLCRKAVMQLQEIQQQKISTLESDKKKAEADRDDRNTGQEKIKTKRRSRFSLKDKGLVHDADMPAKIRVSGLTGDASKANGIYYARHDHRSITDTIHGKPVYVQQGTVSRHALHDETVQKLFFHVEHEAGRDSAKQRSGEKIAPAPMSNQSRLSFTTSPCSVQ